MNRKKYKVTAEEYKNFERQYLMDILRNADEYQTFGQAFLSKFDRVVEEYINLGGDFGLAEANKLWNEPNIDRAKLMIKNWIE